MAEAATRSRKDKSPNTAAVLAALVERDPALVNHPERLSWANDRWLSGISHLEGRIRGNRKAVYWLRGPIVFGSLLVPILATGAVNSTDSLFWPWATVVISVFVALCTSIDQVIRPAARWRLVRETRGALEAEGWAFLHSAAGYAEPDDDVRFQLFFNAVEHLWGSTSTSIYPRWPTRRNFRVR